MKNNGGKFRKEADDADFESPKPKHPSVASNAPSRAPLRMVQRRQQQVGSDPT